MRKETQKKKIALVSGPSIKGLVYVLCNCVPVCVCILQVTQQICGVCIITFPFLQTTTQYNKAMVNFNEC